MPAVPDFDLYEELEVAPHASEEVIKAAYQRLARMHHPDTGRGDISRMARLNLAWDTLSDPVRRREYDLHRQRVASMARNEWAYGAYREAEKRPRFLSRVWGRTKGWVIAILILGGIGVGVSYYQEQDARQVIEAQNDAADDDRISVGSSSSSSVFSLRTGDCIADALPGLGTEQYSSVNKVPCSSARATARVIYSFTVARDGAYPPESYFDAQVLSRCPEQTTTWFYPVPEGWRLGDRTISCMAKLD